MSLNSQNDDFSSVVAEFEETAPSQPRSQPPQSPAQGGTMSPPTTTPTNLGVAVAVAVANTPMDVAGPVLSHIATIALHAEETVAAITHDMDMSTVAYIACRATGNSLQSQLHLSHLNNLFQHVVEFATSTTVMGYLDGVTPDRLERACNNSSHLYQSIEAAATKARLFARCNKRRVKHIKGDVIRVIRELEESVHQFVWMMEAHLRAQLPGWGLLVELLRFAREAWEEVTA